MIKIKHQLSTFGVRWRQASAADPHSAASKVFAIGDLVETILAHAVGAPPHRQAPAGGQQARFVDWTKLRRINKTCRAAADSHYVVGALLGVQPAMAPPHYAALRAGKLWRNRSIGRCVQSCVRGSSTGLSVAFSPDDTCLAVGENSYDVRL